jgi:hypothetical protein
MGNDFRKPMTCEYIGKQRSSGENSWIVTGGLEIELTGASAVLHDVAVECHPHPPHYENLRPLVKGSSNKDFNRVGHDRVVENLCYYEQ